MTDPDDSDFRRRLRGTEHPWRTAGVVLLALAWVALVMVVGFHLTSPWPTRGPGGGRGTNLWGPLVTLAAAVAPLVLLAFHRRRE